QAEVAFVDQVGERHALVLVLLGDRHHEAEVRAHQLVERLLFPLLDPLRKRDLLLAGDERVLADLPEILVQRPFVERCTFRRVQLHGLVTPPRRAHDAARNYDPPSRRRGLDRKSTRLNSSHEWISYAVFCLKKKTV